MTGLDKVEQLQKELDLVLTKVNTRALKLDGKYLEACHCQSESMSAFPTDHSGKTFEDHRTKFLPHVR